jgi:hypothetical protein
MSKKPVGPGNGKEMKATKINHKRIKPPGYEIYPESLGAEPHETGGSLANNSTLEEFRRAMPDLPVVERGLRLHLLYPPVAWAEVGNQDRLTFLRAYLERVVETQRPGMYDMVEAPGGFHQDCSMDQVEQAMREMLTGLKGSRILVSAGMDTLDGTESSYILDLSGSELSWPVVVRKFRQKRVHAGHPEDARSYYWSGYEAFALCCADGECALGGKPPKSLEWTATGWHIVFCNVHYHGDRGVGLWEKSNAGRIAFGLRRLVNLQSAKHHGQGLAVVAFYTTKAPTVGRWFYPADLFRGQVSSDDLVSQTSIGEIWYRVLSIADG